MVAHSSTLSLYPYLIAFSPRLVRLYPIARGHELLAPLWRYSEGHRASVSQRRCRGEEG